MLTIAHHAEDEREPAGDQEQQGRREQAVEGLGDEVDHLSPKSGRRPGLKRATGAWPERIGACAPGSNAADLAGWPLSLRLLPEPRSRRAPAGLPATGGRRRGRRQRRLRPEHLRQGRVAQFPRPWFPPPTPMAPISSPSTRIGSPPPTK